MALVKQAERTGRIDIFSDHNTDFRACVHRESLIVDDANNEVVARPPYRTVERYLSETVSQEVTAGGITANVGQVALLIQAIADKWGNEPVVNAGGSTTLVGAAPYEHQLAGSAVTYSGTTLTYLWEKVSGSAVTFSDNTILNPTVELSEAGTYVLRLTATDGTNSAYSQITLILQGA